jgi:hypothetical protein
MSNAVELQAEVPMKASQGLTSRVGTSMHVLGTLGDVRTSVHTFFHGSWPYAVIGLGVMATFVWNAFLAYAVVTVVRRVI